MCFFFCGEGHAADVLNTNSSESCDIVKGIYPYPTVQSKRVIVTGSDV